VQNWTPTPSYAIGYATSFLPEVNLTLGWNPECQGTLIPHFWFFHNVETFYDFMTGWQRLQMYRISFCIRFRFLTVKKPDNFTYLLCRQSLVTHFIRTRTSQAQRKQRIKVNLMTPLTQTVWSTQLSFRYITMRDSFISGTADFCV